MKVYIAGKITGNPCYKKEFKKAEKALRKMGHSVMNPAWLGDYPEFSHEDYMEVTRKMQDLCEGVFFLENWYLSEGAKREYFHAIELKQKRYFRIQDINLSVR